MRYVTCLGRKQGQRNKWETNLCEGNHQLAEVTRCVRDNVLLQISLVHLENKRMWIYASCLCRQPPTHSKYPLPYKPLKSRNRCGSTDIPAQMRVDPLECLPS